MSIRNHDFRFKRAIDRSLALILLGISSGCGAGPVAPTSAPVARDAEDPYLWLEQIEEPKSLAFVAAANATSLAELQGNGAYRQIYDRVLAVLDNRDRIPFVVQRADGLYNFWKDAEHVRGVWRRTTWAEYQKPQPAWDVVIDVDALAASEHENWVWAGATCLPPRYDRCLIRLSRGGGDAAVTREFDIGKRSFVADGFNLPEAKSEVDWIDEDHLFVATDFGPGSLTQSGYPRLLKEWRRNTPLQAARTVFDAKESDVGVGAEHNFRSGAERDFVRRAVTFWSNQVFWRQGAELRKVDKPDDANVEVDGDVIYLTLRTPWTVNGRTFPAGALLAANFAAYMQGERDLTVLFAPTPRTSLSDFVVLPHHLLLTVLDNVTTRVEDLVPKHTAGKLAWQTTALRLPGVGTATVTPVDRYASDDFFLTFADFLTPTTLYVSRGDKPLAALKKLPAFFAASGLQVRQLTATSKDGAQIPYFVVSSGAQKDDGTNPTLLYGYGGFEVALQPDYLARPGVAWLERGGVYVLANLRGGGEFGPTWHQAAVKEHRQRAYDDFAAVAEDLIARRITSPRHLAIQGGSNGGLLVGVVATQRPELFKAAVCQVPLLDMKRYTKLLAGASWVGEYGDPDVPAEWAYIGAYSPYQRVRKDGKYPRIFFLTSTRDDRVHPGHARKMYARMRDWGHDVLYFENTEGGHAGAANNPQQAKMTALSYTFLWNELR